MADLLCKAPAVFTSHKAGAAGGTGFFAVLMIPVGADNVPAGLVLIQAVMAMIGYGDPVDPADFGAAFTLLWGALGVGAAALVTTYLVPNKLKSGTPAGDAASGGGKSLPSLAAFVLAAGMLAVLLSGCSMLPYYPQVKALADQGIDTAIEDRRDVNDKKANVIKALAGEVTRGAMLRQFTPDEQCAIDTLILGSPTQACSNMDRIAEAMEKLATALDRP